MTLSGIGNSLSSLNQTTNPQDRAQKLMKRMDTDGDGKISKQEFAAFGAKMKAHGHHRHAGGADGVPDANAPSADDLFAKADKDGDGSLSINDLSAMMSEHEAHAAAYGAHAAGGHPPSGAGSDGSLPD